MTRLQRIAAELGERRARREELLALLDADDPGIPKSTVADAKRKWEGELLSLTAKITDLQGQWDTEQRAEGDAEARALGMIGNGDGEAAEVRQLRGRVNLVDYLSPASAGAAISGAAGEFNAALGVPMAGPGGGVAVPWAALLGAEHERGVRAPMAAFTDTGDHDGPQVDRPILQRLFGPGVGDALGVAFDSVPPGRAEWPLLATGASPVQKAEGTAATDATAATFTVATLKPKRLTAEYEVSHEIIASVVDIERALRTDIMAAARSKMQDALVNGPSAGAHEIEGFIAELGAATDLSTAEATASDYGRLPQSAAVDGVHAERWRCEVSGDHSAVTRPISTRRAPISSQQRRERIGGCWARRSMSCMASTHTWPKQAVSMKRNPNCLHSARPERWRAGNEAMTAWPP